MVTKNIITEQEARELFKMCVLYSCTLSFLLFPSPRHILQSFPNFDWGLQFNLIVNNVISHRFYQGCSTFLPVFDSQTDTFDALHERSPFAVDCICMVAARVQCEGGPPTETFKKCLDEVQSICSRTLFSPVTRQEVVQSMGMVIFSFSCFGLLSSMYSHRFGMGR